MAQVARGTAPLGVLQLTRAALAQGFYVKTGTVLLRRDDAKEGQYLLLFLRDFGVRRVGAPRASGKTRFGGATEPLVWCAFSLYQSPNRLYLQSAEVKEDFLRLRRTPLALLCALRLYRLTARETPVDCENDELLKFLWNALLQLQENCPPEIVEFRYTWKMLNVMGIAPSLEICSECGGRLGDAAVTEEGLLCPSCSKGAGRPISAGELSKLRTSVALSQENFILWSKKTLEADCFKTNAKRLAPYFKNMR